MPATVCARAKPNKERVKRDRAVNQTACPKVRAGFPWGSWKEHAEHYETTRLRGKAHEDMLLNLDRLRGTIKEESQKLQGSVSQKIDSVRQARAECHAPLRRRPGC